MKILITGGAGFIGSNITDKLLEQGHKVVVVDNFITGRFCNLPLLKENDGLGRIGIIPVSVANLQVYRQNICDIRMHDIFNKFKPDVVIHAAASYRNPDAWDMDAETNIFGTINIVRLSEQFKVKKLIYFQTALCYGLHPKNYPIMLGDGYFSGSSINTAGSSYAISKTAAEMYISLSKIPSTISFRLANIYGRRNVSGAIPSFYKNIINNEGIIVVDSKRDFVYIDDMMEVIFDALTKRMENQHEYFHISSGRDYNIVDIYRTVLLEAMKYGRYRPKVKIVYPGKDDTKTLTLHNYVTAKKFSWKPRTDIMDGIKETIRWYNENPIEQTYTHLKLK